MMPLGAVFLLAGLHAPLGWGARVYAGLCLVFAGLGAFTSGWHVYIQYAPNPPSCLGNLSVVFDYNPFFTAIKKVFANAGECTNIDWHFLGLSMPAWVFIWFVALGSLALATNWKKLG